MPKSRAQTEITHKEWFIWVIATVLLMMGWMKVNLQPPNKRRYFCWKMCCNRLQLEEESRKFRTKN
jgi:hypothetical protein